MHMPNKRKLTDEQIDEIVRRFYDEGAKQADLAKEFGVAQCTISVYVNTPEKMERFIKHSTAHKVRAQLMINRSLEEAVETQLGLMRGAYEDQYKYLSQNAARDILDRGGVRAEKEEKPEIKITMDFGESGGFNLGVPDHSRDNDAVPEDAGEE